MTKCARVALGLLLFGLGCEEVEGSRPQSDGTTPVSDAGASERADARLNPLATCEQLPLAACAGDPRCVPFAARRFDATRRCAQPRAVLLACATVPESERGCDDAMTQARDPSGQLWEFSNSCIPPGFTSVTFSQLGFSETGAIPDGWPACESESSCMLLAPEACAHDARCTEIRGRRFDAKRACRSAETEPLGCMDASSACGDAITLGRATEATYEFTGTCLPRGFSRVDLDDLVSQPSSLPSSTPSRWPACSPERTCAELSVGDCTKQHGCAPVSGRRLDSSRQCIGATTAVSCADADVSCPPSIKYASHPSTSEIWEFGDCLPADWKRFEASDFGTAGVPSWAACP
jgi:hypothetical protein